MHYSMPVPTVRIRIGMSATAILHLSKHLHKIHESHQTIYTTYFLLQKR